MIKRNNYKKNRVWISWESQRRSSEMAKRIGAKPYIFDFKGILRYPISIAKTLLTLFREKPHIFFVQNPSMLLAALACIYGIISDTHIVVDRHTTFRLNKPHTGSFKIWLKMRLHYFTLKYADITIVTNDFLADLVKKSNGRPAVLPDPLPNFTFTELYKLRGKINLLLISSFDKDEPVLSVLDSMRRIDRDICLYITGNYKKRDANLKNKIPANVVLMGFIPDQTFVNMLFSVDASMVLTTADYCMLCGCYESVAAEKPLITSDKSVLKEYFKEALFVNNTPCDIHEKIEEMVDNIDTYKDKTIEMKCEIKNNWQKMYQKLEIMLNDLK